MKSNWIHSARYDGLFFFGGVLFTPLVFFIFLFLVEGLKLPTKEAILYLYTAFIIIFDHPHLFETLSRCFVDKTEFNRHKKLHILTPILILLPAPLYYYLEWKEGIYLLFMYFGMWHVFKQNIGFLKLYRRLGGEREGLDLKLDKLSMWSCLFVALVPDFFESSWEFSPFDLREYYELSEGISYLIFVAILLMYFLRQLYLWKKNQLNLGKFCFVTSVMFHYLVLYVLIYSSFEVPLLLVAILDAIYHDVQYMGWMMLYQKRCLDKKVNIVGRWLIYSFLFSLISGVVYYFKDSIPLSIKETLEILFILFAIYHYFIDAFIWKFSTSDELKPLSEKC